jgi:hypothetical protein
MESLSLTTNKRLRKSRNRLPTGHSQSMFLYEHILSAGSSGICMQTLSGGNVSKVSHSSIPISMKIRTCRLLTRYSNAQ